MFGSPLRVSVELLSVLGLAGALLGMSAQGQQLSQSEKSLIDSARSKYYDLKSAGFQSLSCSLKFDLATVPLVPRASDDPTRKLLEQTAFDLTLDENGRPRVEHHFPEAADEGAKQGALQVTNLMTSFVMGLFQTWPTKGLQGPIPPFDSQVASVTATDRGYVFSLRTPGSPVQVTTDKDYLVTDIVSMGGKIKEHPTYVPSPGGLVFSGNDAVDASHPGAPVDVHYELRTKLIEGLRVPSSAHLRVNENIDVTFTLERCVVNKAKVLNVAPPPGD